LKTQVFVVVTAIFVEKYVTRLVAEIWQNASPHLVCQKNSSAGHHDMHH